VLRLRPSSASSHARSAPQPGVVLAAAFVVGVAAEAAAYEWSDVGHWVPDLVVGLVLVTSGVSAFGRRRGTGLLLAAAGFAWSSGTSPPSPCTVTVDRSCTSS